MLGEAISNCPDNVSAMLATLYGSPPSHPSHSARLMLEHKRMEHKVVWLLPGLWPVLLRTRGFRGGTVPALKLNGRRIQDSREISRALEEAQPDPPLFPADPQRRLAVEEAERWGEQVLQAVPRRIIRWIATRNQSMRAAMARDVGMPAPALAAAVNLPAARYLARKAGASDERVRRDLAGLPGLLDEVDRLIADGVIGAEPPNAADYQIATTVRALISCEDVAPAIRGRPAEELAMRIVPDWPTPVAGGYLPHEWLPGAAGKPASA
jgi:glutathione S-transferase